ncbi:MAG: four helix bundle protein [Bacteroidetes bacterium]|nr:four helix bundle protein [Bacteroidota bacterium]
MKEKKEFVRNVRELQVYQLAFDSAMKIFMTTKDFPKEEKYSLTDQIRRSSRSVCSNLAEGWYKRRYLAAFIHKLTDSVQEASETQTWLEFSLACGYIDNDFFEKYYSHYEKIIGQLITMEQKAKSFCNLP